MEAAEAYCKTCILLLNIVGRVRPLSKKQLTELFALHNMPINESLVRGIEDEKDNPEVISLADFFNDRLGNRKKLV